MKFLTFVIIFLSLNLSAFAAFNMKGENPSVAGSTPTSYLTESNTKPNCPAAEQSASLDKPYTNRVQLALLKEGAQGYKKSKDAK